MLKSRDPASPTRSYRQHGDGGFPGPINMVNLLARRAAPNLVNKLERKMTVASFQELDEKKTPWLNFSGLVVGRNSDFRTETLSDDQIEQLGGAEYKALRLLSYLVPAVRFYVLVQRFWTNALAQYLIFTQLVSFTLFAPWVSTTSQYDEVFEAQPRLVNKTWSVPSLGPWGAPRICYSSRQLGSPYSRSWQRIPAEAPLWLTCKPSSPPFSVTRGLMLDAGVWPPSSGHIS